MSNINKLVEYISEVTSEEAKLMKNDPLSNAKRNIIDPIKSSLKNAYDRATATSRPSALGASGKMSSNEYERDAIATKLAKAERVDPYDRSNTTLTKAERVDPYDRSNTTLTKAERVDPVEVLKPTKVFEKSATSNEVERDAIAAKLAKSNPSMLGDSHSSRGVNPEVPKPTELSGYEKQQAIIKARFAAKPSISDNEAERDAIATKLAKSNPSMLGDSHSSRGVNPEVPKATTWEKAVAASRERTTNATKVGDIPSEVPKAEPGTFQKGVNWLQQQYQDHAPSGKTAALAAGGAALGAAGAYAAKKMMAQRKLATK